MEGSVEVTAPISCLWVLKNSLSENFNETYIVSGGSIEFN
jgi:hypothetical protein